MADQYTEAMADEYGPYVDPYAELFADDVQTVEMDLPGAYGPPSRIDLLAFYRALYDRRNEPYHDPR